MNMNTQDRQSLYRGPIYRLPPPIYRAVSVGYLFPINRTSIKRLPNLIGKFHYWASIGNEPLQGFDG